MRRTVLIVPGMLGGTEGDSFLRQKLPALSTLSDIGEVRRVAKIPESETPEAMLLGLGPSQVALRQGPLTVSAFGFDPPERSTHFHLSLMTFADGVATVPSVLPTPKEADLILAESKRLDTKLLTVLKGEALDHALVWEALGDLETTPPKAIHGKDLLKHLPNGDGDVGLRRLIDDSINLLSTLELNERRIDEGLPPFNALLPWGHGTRTPVANLALRRGEPAIVESASLRLAGLTRLAGYRHGDRREFGVGIRTKLAAIAGRAVRRDLTIVYVEAAAELRAREKAEELDWFIREFDRDLLQPLLNDVQKDQSRLQLIAPGTIDSSISESMPSSPAGLALVVEPRSKSKNAFPFDERSIDEKSIPSVDLWTLVEQGVSL